MSCAPQPRCCSFSIAYYPALRCCDCCELLLEHKNGGREAAFLDVISVVISQVWVSHSPQPRADIPHLPWLQIDSLPSWLALGLEDLLPSLLDQRSGCPGANPWSAPRQSCFSLGKFEQVQKQLLLLCPNLQTPREANNYHSQQNKAISILLCTANEAN